MKINKKLLKVVEKKIGEKILIDPEVTKIMSQQFGELEARGIHDIKWL